MKNKLLASFAIVSVLMISNAFPISVSILCHIQVDLNSCQNNECKVTHLMTDTSKGTSQQESGSCIFGKNPNDLKVGDTITCTGLHQGKNLKIKSIQGNGSFELEEAAPNTQAY